MSLHIRRAAESDLPLLAQMNKRLIEDQGSRNPMSVEQLQNRMSQWLNGDWTIEFLEDTVIVGYVVYLIRRDEFFPDKTEVYIRQFYVERDQRGRGLGSAAFQLLRETRFPAGSRLALDVLATNPKGFNFWRRVGFQPYYTVMDLQN
jgi:GNAT superfamily N-acetyltransferase